MNREQAKEVLEEFVLVNKLTTYLNKHYYNSGNGKDKVPRGPLYIEVCDNLGIIRNKRFHAAILKAADILGYKCVRVDSKPMFKYIKAK